MILGESTWIKVDTVDLGLRCEVLKHLKTICGNH